jgi:hypothetical protein
MQQFSVWLADAVKGVSRYFDKNLSINLASGAFCVAGGRSRRETSNPQDWSGKPACAQWQRKEFPWIYYAFSQIPLDKGYDIWYFFVRYN